MSWVWYEKNLGNGYIFGCWSKKPITIVCNDDSIVLENKDLEIEDISDACIILDQKNADLRDKKVMFGAHLFSYDDSIGACLLAETKDIIEDIR